MDDPEPQPSTSDQVGPHDEAFQWNGSFGRTWIELQDVLDTMYRPFEQALVDASAELAARRVLDVGCGTGATTLALARHLDRVAADAGGDGTTACVGLDVSVPMLEVAQRRARDEGSSARFVVGDAQRHRFDGEPFDVVVSRFGVMFFDDEVAAFANLRGATAPGGALRVAVWRRPEENPFMSTAARAASEVLPLPSPAPGEPGPYGLAEPAHVHELLDAAGWHDVDLVPLDLECRLPLTELDRYATRLGPVGRALTDADDARRAQVAEVVRPAFDPFVDGDELRYTAACWMVHATA